SRSTHRSTRRATKFGSSFGWTSSRRRRTRPAHASRARWEAGSSSRRAGRLPLRTRTATSCPTWQAIVARRARRPEGSTSCEPSPPRCATRLYRPARVGYRPRMSDLAPRSRAAFHALLDLLREVGDEHFTMQRGVLDEPTAAEGYRFLTHLLAAGCEH